jgi:hypothetical protein
MTILYYSDKQLNTLLKQPCGENAQIEKTTLKEERNQNQNGRLPIRPAELITFCLVKT